MQLGVAPAQVDEQEGGRGGGGAKGGGGGGGGAKQANSNLNIHRFGL